MSERNTRLRAIESSIERYESLLKSNLNKVELRFVEQRLSEERFALAMAQFVGPNNSSETTQLPDSSR
jgi:hypothetical protein